MSFADRDHKREACFELAEKLFKRFEDSGVKPWEMDIGPNPSVEYLELILEAKKTDYLKLQVCRPRPTKQDIQEVLYNHRGWGFWKEDDIPVMVAIADYILIEKITLYLTSKILKVKFSDSEIYERALNSYKTAKEKEDENVAKLVLDVYEFLLRHFFKIIPIFASTIMLVCAICLDKYDVFEGFYTVLRLVVCATSVFYVVKFRKEFFRWIFGVLAVLYNPVFQIHLGDKDVWNVINIITIIFMWLALFIEGADKFEEETIKKESN